MTLNLENLKLDSEWFGSDSGAFMINGFDVAHITITTDDAGAITRLQVNACQPGDSHGNDGFNYPPVDIDLAPWEDE